VKLPFETISALGEKANKNFEEGKKIEEDLGALGQAIKAAPVYESHKTKFINEYNKRTQDLVDEAKGDYGSPEFKRKAQKLIQEFKTRPEIDAFAQTNKAFQDYQSEKKDAKNAMNLDWTYQKDKQGNYVQLDVIKQGIYSPKFTQYEDWNKTAKEVMGHVAPSGGTNELAIDFNAPTATLSNGETAVYSNKTKGYVGVSDPRVQKLSKMMASEYATTVAGKHHLQSLLGADIDYKTLSIQALNDPEAAKTKEAVDTEFTNHMYRANANQIGGTSTSSIDYHYEHDRAKASANDKKAADESNKYKPSYEGNIDKTPSTRANALVTMGMDPTTMDDNADIKYNKYNQPDLKDIQAELTKLNTIYKGNTSSPDYMNELNKINSKLQASKGNQEIATKYYSDLVRIAGNNNIDPKQFMDNKGNVDYKALKERLITAGQNINTQAGSIQGMDASLVEGLGAHYFGEHTAQGFTKAGAFNKLTIYENNNPNTKDKIESEGLASKLAENARFTGLDFNDKNLGSMAFTATEGKESVEPKLYNAVTSDKVLKTLMEPVHNFTQQVKNAMVGKQSPEEVQNNKKALLGYTDKYGNKINGALGEVASNVLRGNNPNKKYLLEQLNKVMDGVNYGSNKTLAYGTNNDKDKIFIGQPIINEQGIPEEKTYRIDVRTGMVDVVELGNIQNEESTNIQNKIAPAYNQKAPGYKPQDVTYK
jgi:hypothetical protein